MQAPPFAPAFHARCLTRWRPNCSVLVSLSPRAANLATKKAVETHSTEDLEAAAAAHKHADAVRVRGRKRRAKATRSASTRFLHTDVGSESDDRGNGAAEGTLATTRKDWLKSQKRSASSASFLDVEPVSASEDEVYSSSSDEDADQDGPLLPPDAAPKSPGMVLPDAPVRVAVAAMPAAEKEETLSRLHAEMEVAMDEEDYDAAEELATQVSQIEATPTQEELAARTPMTASAPLQPATAAAKLGKDDPRRQKLAAHKDKMQREIEDEEAKEEVLERDVMFVASMTQPSEAPLIAPLPPGLQEPAAADTGPKGSRHTVGKDDPRRQKLAAHKAKMQHQIMEEEAEEEEERNVMAHVPSKASEAPVVDKLAIEGADQPKQEVSAPEPAPAAAAAVAAAPKAEEVSVPELAAAAAAAPKEEEVSTPEPAAAAAAHPAMARARKRLSTAVAQAEFTARLTATHAKLSEDFTANYSSYSNYSSEDHMDLLSGLG